MAVPEPARPTGPHPPDTADGEVLPAQTSDDVDADWRDRLDPADEEARLLEDRPPHWD